MQFELLTHQICDNNEIIISFTAFWQGFEYRRSNWDKIWCQKHQAAIRKTQDMVALRFMVVELEGLEDFVCERLLGFKKAIGKGLMRTEQNVIGT